MRPILVFALCSAGLLAQLAPARITPVRPSAPALKELQAALDLTDQQVEKLQKLQADRLTASRQLWESISQKQRAMTEMVNSGSADPGALGTLMIEIHRLQKQSNPNDPSYHESAITVLTPEQREKLKKLEEAIRLRPAVDEAAGVYLLVPQK